MIPARLGSTRLPRKPLADVEGRPLIVRVLENARGIRSATAVVVATDSDEIATVVRAAGGEAVLTSADCVSGTDRVAEAARDRGEEIVVNVQGDEPELPPEDVDRLVAAMVADPSLRMGTLAVRAETDDLGRPSVVKVVCDRNGRALYFSRAAVPYVRDAARFGNSARDARRERGEAGGVAGGGRGSERTGAEPPDGLPARPLRHVGVYAFRRDALLEFAALPPTPLEQTESLEQLRALEHGWSIRVVVVGRAPPGIDTPGDLDRLRARVRSRASGSAESGGLR